MYGSHNIEMDYYCILLQYVEARGRLDVLNNCSKIQIVANILKNTLSLLHTK